MDPLIERVLIVAGVFSAVSLLLTWISDWRFRREMERLDNDPGRIPPLDHRLHHHNHHPDPDLQASSEPR